MTWVERKLLGRMQLRYGPNRAGPFGLLQPIADLVKLIRKESFYPATAVDFLYITAPIVSTFTALLAFAVIPWGEGWHIAGYDISGEIADVPISLILIFALGALGVYGFIVGGWASDSKYALLGSMRTCAQLVSYEVGLALAVLGPLWFLLKVLILIGFFIWLRATLPRLRYDQLMAFGWKVLLPVATLNALVTAALVVAFS